MKTDIQRINTIIGQLEGIKHMLDEEKDCFLVLTQIKAAKSALTAFSTQYLSDKFVECMDTCKGSEQKDVCASFIKELTS